MLGVTVDQIIGLGEYERTKMAKLINEYNTHAIKNIEKNKYYEGKIPLSAVNLGIALPTNFNGLEIGCSWGAKTVDVLAARSMSYGYVGAGGADSTEMDQIVDESKCFTKSLVSESLAYLNGLKAELAALTSDLLVDSAYVSEERLNRVCTHVVRIVYCEVYVTGDEV